MKVENYHVRWQYKVGQNIVHGNTDITECNIMDTTDNSVITGTALKYYTDKYDREKGRMISFKKAIANFSKELRTQFWEAYRNLNPNKPRW
jgi:hypothetical protein